MGAAAFLRHLASVGFDGEIVLEINTRKCRDVAEREADLRESLEFAREHSAGRPRRDAPRRRAAVAGREPRTPARRSSPPPASCFAAQGFAGTSVRAVAAAAGVDAALVHHYFGTKDDLFVAALELPVDPRERLAGVIAQGPDGAGERMLRVFLSVWDDPELRLPLLGLARGMLDPSGQRLIRDGFLPVVLHPGRRGARHRPARGADAAGRQPGDRPDPHALRARGRADRLACRPTTWWRSTPRRSSAT